MPAAGDYDRKFTHMLYTLTKDSDTGQEQESWEEGSDFWGYVSAFKKFKDEVEFGIIKRASEVEIKLRSWVDIDPKDRLVDTWFGGTYRIKGRGFGDYETIIEAEEILDE